MTEGAEALSARYSLPTLIGYLIVLGGMAALAVSFALTAGDGVSSAARAIILIAGSFFALASLGFLRCLTDRRVQVRIDAAGLMVRGHSDAIIPLRSLSGIADRGNRMIFGLTKPDRFPIKGRWRRFILRINGSNGGAYFGNVWIWTTLLDCRPRDILNAVHDFRPPTAFELDLRALGAAAKTDIVPVRL